MKQGNVLWAVGVMILGAPLWVQAANSPLEAHAARTQLRDFIESTEDRISTLEAALRMQQQRIDRLEEENRRLNAELARLSRINPTAGLEQDLRTLKQAIEQVDRKRIADANSVDTKLSKVSQTLDRIAQSSRAPRPTRSVDTISQFGPDTQFGEYEVKPADYLLKIIKKLKEVEGISVTQKEMEQANPGVDWNRLQVGQKLNVPIKK